MLNPKIEPAEQEEDNPSFYSWTATLLFNRVKRRYDVFCEQRAQHYNNDIVNGLKAAYRDFSDTANSHLIWYTRRLNLDEVVKIARANPPSKALLIADGRYALTNVITAACELKNPPLSEKDLNTQYAILEFLVKYYNIDVNNVDSEGNTLFHYLVNESSEFSTQLLMKCINEGLISKAAINKPNIEGRMPIHYLIAIPSFSHVMNERFDIPTRAKMLKVMLELGLDTSIPVWDEMSLNDFAESRVPDLSHVDEYRRVYPTAIRDLCLAAKRSHSPKLRQ